MRQFVAAATQAYTGPKKSWSTGITSKAKASLSRTALKSAMQTIQSERVLRNQQINQSERDFQMPTMRAETSRDSPIQPCSLHPENFFHANGTPKSSMKKRDPRCDSALMRLRQPHKVVDVRHEDGLILAMHEISLSAYHGHQSMPPISGRSHPKVPTQLMKTLEEGALHA